MIINGHGKMEHTPFMLEVTAAFSSYDNVLAVMRPHITKFATNKLDSIQSMYGPMYVVTGVPK